MGCGCRERADNIRNGTGAVVRGDWAEAGEQARRFVQSAATDAEKAFDRALSAAAARLSGQR